MQCSGTTGRQDWGHLTGLLDSAALLFLHYQCGKQVDHAKPFGTFQVTYEMGVSNACVALQNLAICGAMLYACWACDKRTNRLGGHYGMRADFKSEPRFRSKLPDNTLRSTSA